jgi:hypothetical protein
LDRGPALAPVGPCRRGVPRPGPALPRLPDGRPDPLTPDAANAPKTLGGAGYEAWYVTANDGDGRGLWLRWTSFRPGRRSPVAPHAALWAFTFDRADPGRNIALKSTYPLTALELQRPFSVRLAGTELDLWGCRGRLAGARWDLRWESAEPEGFAFLDPRWQFISSVGNAGAQPRLRITGWVDSDAGRWDLRGAWGGQQHTWGSSHALEWNWGFAAGDWGWLDGATTRIRSRLGRVIAGTAVGSRLGDRRLEHNRPLTVLRSPAAMSPDGWRFAAGGLRLAVVPRREDLVGVRYDDPAGGSRVCYHTEVADLEVDLDGEVVRRPTAAAFEYASEAPLAGLPVRV